MITIKVEQQRLRRLNNIFLRLSAFSILIRVELSLLLSLTIKMWTKCDSLIMLMLFMMQLLERCMMMTLETQQSKDLQDTRIEDQG